MSPADHYGHVDAGGGVRLGYRKVGSGPQTIVVLHGGPGFTMDYLADDLLQLARDHTLIFYDQRGTGRSTLVNDAEGLDAQRFADDLEAVRRHFNLQKPTLLGHSWGAGVAALYATRFPQHVGRLIIVGGVPIRGTDLQRTFATLRNSPDQAWLAELRQRSVAWRDDPGNAQACRAFYSTWFKPFFVDTAALSRSKGDFCAGSAASLINKTASVDRFVLQSLGDYEWASALKQLGAPALVIHGAADPIPAETAAEWARTLPNARLLLLGGVGHFPYLEAPDKFFSAVGVFMRDAWPGDARSP